MVLICLLTLAATVTSTIASINEAEFAPEDIITKDVAIIGGGASGTYAAVRLREDLNTNIVVIEEKDRLGGHVNTYVDPISNISIDYGVEAYLRYGDTAAFFTRFHVPITPYTQSPQTSVYVSTTSGSNLTSYTAPSLEAQIGAIATWLNLTEKYANITLPGLWNFPAGSNIPSELLLPFGEFAQRHGIEAAAPIFTVVSNVGIGGIEKVLTLYVLFAFGIPVTQEFLNSSLFVPANLSNSVLYDRAYNLLRDDVILQSRVTIGERSANGVKLVIQSKNSTSKKLIKAKRMLFTPPPSVRNLEPFGLTGNETAALSTFTGTWSFAAVARIPAIPAGYSVYFYAPDATLDNYLGIRDWPWTLSITTAPKIPPEEHLFEILFAANYSLSHADAKRIITTAVQNLTISGTFASNSTNATIDFVAFQDHNSILWRQPASELRAGIVQDVYALQGQHSTWYTGGLWSEDYTGNVWAFTDSVLPRLIASLHSNGTR
ncbi:hypothetical protein NA57DRAFT_37580 [Rhizodiscina lignyota]|uniref:Amine oxidase n=1 Tax=Rhizodiscina lignyota TaxID=1504668 RepID=A0A9P4IFR8_9PEZI|nr:hypothetical protein NA57DRAFT_37580 [Rhizodiscina lignyota]